MNKHLDRALDRVWDVMEPLAGPCPVCAFFRGALAGALLAGVLAWSLA